MSGGIVKSRPFQFNIKCIIFTAILAGGYWKLPPKNIYVLIFLLWIPYVALAWYDYSYNCQDKLNYTLFPFGRYVFLPFKPKEYEKTYTSMTKEQKQTIRRMDHIYGWTILIIILIYVMMYNEKIEFFKKTSK